MTTTRQHGIPIHATSTPDTDPNCDMHLLDPNDPLAEWTREVGPWMRCRPRSEDG